MGKGGGAPSGGSQTVTQTNLPEYARPYFENLLERGQAESYREYTPYEGQRIAPVSPGQQAVYGEVAGMQTPGQFGQATGLTAEAARQAGGYGGAAAGVGQQGLAYGQQAAGMGQQGLGYGATGMGQAMGMAGQAAQAGQQYQQMATDPSQIQQYMSPYMQNVVDAQKQEAIRDAQKQQLGASLGSARQGTYGGARQLLAQTERERNLGAQLANIQSAGQQKAFEAAQQAQQYGADLGLRGLQAGISGTDVGTRLGLAGIDTGIRGAQAGMAGVDRALSGYQTGLQGTSQIGQMGGQMADIGTAEQAANLERLRAQEGVGAQQRGYEQSILDQQYADFLRQRDYPMEQLGYFSSLLRGLPMQMGSTQTTYAPPPSALQQVGGLGLTGLGLYNLGR